MKAHLKKVHLIVGFIELVIFPLTEAYMRIYLTDEFAASDRLRFSMRAKHTGAGPNRVIASNPLCFRRRNNKISKPRPH
jgi:hypothetical protein